LEESQVGAENVIKVDLRVLPGNVHFRGLIETLRLAGDDGYVDNSVVNVDAGPKSSTEQIDAHDAEDEPEHQTNEQHVEDSWDSLYQRVHHHLHKSAK